MEVLVAKKMLSKGEQEILTRLDQVRVRQARKNQENQLYYLGKQNIEFLGLRLREEWIAQAFPLTWCRTLVSVVVERQQVARLLRRGNFTEDKELRSLWDESDMDAQFTRFATDLAIYGRAYLSVAMDEKSGRPRMVVEPVTAMTLLHDALGETLAAQRIYFDTAAQETRSALYLPDVTIILKGSGAGAQEVDRIEHGLGRVPVVMAVMGDIDGTMDGESVFEPLKRLSDMSAEVLLNMRVVLETSASPQKVFLDAVNEVVDEDGNPVSVFEAFYDSILTVFSGQDDGEKKAKQADVKQLAGADLTPFFKSLETLGQQASSASGLPMRMLGHVTANPPSEMTVRGEEARLVRMIEMYNAVAGMALGWGMAIGERLRTGVWPEDGSIDVSHRDPGTPTQAQQADALTKYVAQGIMSKRSALEELGWSDARIDREMQRLTEEADVLGMAYRGLGRHPEPDVIDEVDL